MSTTKGFNHGYSLAKYSTKMAIQLMDSFTDHSNPYVKGFGSGILEYVEKDLTLEESKKLRKHLDRSKSFGQAR